MIERLIASRMQYADNIPLRKSEGEGGCGVIGLACEEKIAARHLLPALQDMCNRGNGKGGGIAAVGLSAQAFGVDQTLLDHDYLLAVAYLDRTCQAEVEKEHIYSVFDVDHAFKMPHLRDYKALGLEIAPPYVICYFVRVKKEFITAFIEKHHLQNASLEVVEDEIVYQNSYQLNRTFYAATGEKRAFVLSHGKNMLVLKLVGYGGDVIHYYKLEDFEAHVWIGHHRYPTKGRVWHPGGAHPFIGLNEALVHNGDFANYYSICEYLAQRKIHPLFLTDTEVAVLLFDLLYRIYQYPLEYVIEALAPTTERDFSLLPHDKQSIYELIQKTHMHGSPDGPWFFLVAQSVVATHQKKTGYRLIGITDTSMLRPQVFALQKGPLAIGFAASEKQAIDVTLKSLAKENSQFWPQADFYWNARGGSHTDGGAFIFTVHPGKDKKATLVCSDKFGNSIHAHQMKPPYFSSKKNVPTMKLPSLNWQDLVDWAKTHVFNEDYDEVNQFIETLIHRGVDSESQLKAFEVLTYLIDHRYPLNNMRRSCVNALLNQGLSALAFSIERHPSSLFTYWKFGEKCPHPETAQQTLVIDAKGFAPQGPDSLALAIVKAYKLGFRKMILFDCSGQRFIGNGLGPDSKGVRIDVYGSSGDYLGSGIDGAEIYVHGSAQDQLAQIMKDGKLVVYGDLGQTFLYGAKGGTAFVKGNAAGRPLINAVGHPRVVINGTCLDYLAESFMAGIPLSGGGFVILNAIAFDEIGRVIELDTPYPGNNLFSLASGGAIYVRDPAKKIVKDQLNGGEFGEMSKEDWDLISPYLLENEKLFEISRERLLQYNGISLNYDEVYRKIIPSKVQVLQEEEAWVKGRN